MAKKGRKKGNEGNSLVKAIVVMCILVAMLIGFYYYISHKGIAERDDNVTITKSQQVLMRNLESNYPPSPKEVVKYYCEITQCFYNETHTEEEIEALAAQIRRLYDEELIANQTEERYLEDLKIDIISMSGNEMTISSFGLPSSTEVDFFSEDGYDWARLYCNFNLRQKTKIVNTIEQFLLRKDENGRWKIYGWQLVD